MQKPINQIIHDINPHEYRGYKVNRNGFTWCASDENSVFANSTIEGLYKSIDAKLNKLNKQ